MATALSPAARGATDRVPFLKAHCVDCHGPILQEAELRLDRLSRDLSKTDVFNRWVRIYDRIDKGEMPPKEADSPSDADRRAFLVSLRKDLEQAERARLKKQGYQRVRRMNRVEYEHTLRDLLALPLLRVKASLPEDGKQHGFDKVVGALDISHVQMRKYLQTADGALKQALVRQSKRPETIEWREPAARQNSGRAAIAIHVGAPLLNGKLAPGLTTVVRGNPVDDPGNTYRAAQFRGEADSLIILSGRFGAHQPQGLQPDRFRPPVGGWYRVRFSVWGLRWKRGAIKPAVRSKIRKYIEFGEPWVRDEKQRWKGRRLDEERVREYDENVEFYGKTEATHVVRASLKGEPIGFFDAPSLKPTVHEFTVWLEPGEKVSFHPMTLPATGPRNSASSNGVLSYEGPGIAFDWFDIQGPLLEQWPPERHRRLFGEIPPGANPQPFRKEAPTVGPGKSVTLSNDSFEGAGRLIGGNRLLNINGTTTAHVNCVAPGVYELAVAAFQTRAGDKPAKMQLHINDKAVPKGKFPVTAFREKPQTHRATFKVNRAGSVKIGIEFLNDFFDPDNPDPKLRDRNLYLKAVKVVGPKTSLGTSDASASESESAPDIRRLLRRFADRAFRRPVDIEEIEPYAAIVENRLQSGAGFEESLLAGYQAILCSPDFLFLGLEDQADAGTGYALASRLSYFLWNSMPDETLRKLAQSGKLSQPDVLRAQVERMLDDPRSDRFIEHFLDQWLELEKIDFTTPDPQLYPEFDPWLRDSMLAEARGYFRKLLEEDRSIDHLIDADFVLINQRLAELYDIRGVHGAKLRPVKLKKDSPRGGVLTQGAVLKVTANGTATSPVLRGVWVSERILGIPRDPPPPNIPAIEPDATGAVSIREMIEKHRADPACAKCHAKFDPPGLALESFDVIGGWRERYRLSGRPKRIKVDGKKVLEPHEEVISAKGRRVKLRLGPKVDPSGKLADGRQFDDLADLKSLLLDDREQLAGNVIRQLLVYATGSGIRFSDREEIEAILARSRKTNYGLRSIIHEVVQSRVFRGSGLEPNRRHSTTDRRERTKN